MFLIPKLQTVLELINNNFSDTANQSCNRTVIFNRMSTSTKFDLNFKRNTLKLLLHFCKLFNFVIYYKTVCFNRRVV